MDQIAKSDIFFFIATVAVILVTAIVAAGLLYVVSILRTLKHIAKKAHQQTDALAEDVKDLREEIRDRGVSMKGIASFFTRTAKRRTKK